MTEEHEVEELQSAPTALDYLKNEAEALGVKHHPKIGEAKLREKIQAFKKAQEKEAAKAAKASVKDTPSQGLTRSQKRREQLRMTRVRVSCLNPHYKGLKGQVFSVSNGLVGTVKKYVPFDSPNGWHIPEILLQSLKNKKYQSFREVTTPNGKKIKRSVEVPAFSIATMDPLTPNEYGKIQQQLQATAPTEDY